MPRFSLCVTSYSVLQRQVPKPTFDDTDRTVLGVLSQVFDRHRLAQVCLIVEPATITVATTCGGTLRRPLEENKSSNNSSGNNTDP